MRDQGNLENISLFDFERNLLLGYQEYNLMIG